MAVKEVPETVEFLTEWDGFELPKGILNKMVTGCGATSVAIEDEHKTIICCPRINLILNKQEQYKNTLAVYGRVGISEIKAYIEQTEIPKILVTYDSMPKVAKAIEDKSDWRVVVDEYQYLLIDSSFKSETEMALLDILNEFDYVTYLSATPIADKYMRQIAYFKDVPYTELKWCNVEHPKINMINAKRPIDSALEMIKKYRSGNFPSLNGEISKECVVFLNSVTNIVNIARQAKLTEDEVNIIVGDNEDNDKQLAKVGLKRGRIPLKDEPHKMFTFCTSTTFAGCDFYSKCASTFVISDNKRVNTAIDIATELAQIVGRQRLKSNPFRKTVTFIYNTNDGENDSDSVHASLEKKLRNSYKLAESKNNEKDIDVRQAYIQETQSFQRVERYAKNYVCYKELEDRFEVNRFAYLSDCFSFDVQKENFVDCQIVVKHIEESRMAVNSMEERSYTEQLNCIISCEKFEDRMKRYCEYQKIKEDNPYFLGDAILERQYDDLKMYYGKLGYDRIRALGYKETKLKNELKTYYLENVVKAKFRSIFKVGDRMITDDIKTTMNEVYAEYGIKKNGVASNLEKVYGIKMKPTKITVNGGFRKCGYEFI